MQSNAFIAPIKTSWADYSCCSRSDLTSPLRVTVRVVYRHPIFRIIPAYFTKTWGKDGKIMERARLREAWCDFGTMYRVNMYQARTCKPTTAIAPSPTNDLIRMLKYRCRSRIMRYCVPGPLPWVGRTNDLGSCTLSNCFVDFVEGSHKSNLTLQNIFIC